MQLEKGVSFFRFMQIKNIKISFSDLQTETIFMTALKT